MKAKTLIPWIPNLSETVLKTPLRKKETDARKDKDPLADTFAAILSKTIAGGTK